MNTIDIAGPTCLIAHLLPPSDRASSQVSARDIEYLEAGSELQLPAHRAARRGALAWSCQVTAQDQCGMCNIKCHSRAAGRALGAARHAKIRCSAGTRHQVLNAITNHKCMQSADTIVCHNSAAQAGADAGATARTRHTIITVEIKRIAALEQNDPRAVPRLESGSISKMLQYWQQTLKEWNARNLQKRSLLFVPQFLPRCTHTGQVRFKTKSYNHIHANIFYEMKNVEKVSPAGGKFHWCSTSTVS